MLRNVYMVTGRMLRASILFLLALTAITSSRTSLLRTIWISQTGNDTSECLVNSSYPCQHISYAMMETNMNNTKIILANGTHILDATVRLEQVENFYLIGDPRLSAKPMINCTNTKSAFFFTKTSNINFQRIFMQNCGAIFQSTSEVDGKFQNLTTGFHVTESKDVSLVDIEIVRSVGMGAVFYDVIGNVIFERVHFIDNSGRNIETRKGCSSGGGIYIEFRPTQSNSIGLYNSNGKYVFRSCHFHNNKAENENSVISESIGSQFFSMGRGGGISFISRGESTSNEMTITSCVFTENKALWGAGIFAEFDDKSGNNEITVIDSIFFRNNATMAGGGIRIGVNSNSAMGFNTINIRNTNFTQNSARIGGAFSQYRATVDRREEERVVMENSTFLTNQAFAGTSLHMQYVNIHFINCSILNNTIYAYNQTVASESRGALYCFASNISLHGYNNIVGNSYTAFFLDSCLVVVHNETIFAYNSGILGGAMAIYSHSSIRMTSDSKLYLHNNSAMEKGGAIYVETPVYTFLQSNSTELNIYRCFFKFGDSDGEYKHPEDSNTLIDFKGNFASSSHNGEALWATTLTWCRRYRKEVLNNTIFECKNVVKFNGDPSQKSIVTSPNSIDTKPDDWDAHPGFTKEVEVSLQDENNNKVAGTVRINIELNNGKYATVRHSRLIVNEIGKVNITLIGEEGAKFTVSLKTEGRIPVTKRVIDRTLKKCPPGFYADGNVCKCHALKAGVAYCNEETGTVNILYARWGNPNGGDSFAKHVCPPHYCTFSSRKRATGYAYSEGIQQCAEGRKKESPLCSECEDNKSVVFGAEKCKPCDSKIKGMWLLLIFICWTIFVLLVMLVNLDSYSTYLNAFFFSYQIIPMIIEDSSLDKFISIVINFSQLSGSGKIQEGVCIGFKLDNITKILFNYVIPSYLIICTAFIGTVSYYLKRSPFNTNTTFRAFVFISVVAYCDFTRITFKLLEPININSKYVLYYAAYIPYFGKQHAPYAACAIFVLIFIVIGFPLAIIFSYAITANSKLVKLKAIFDTFKAPFASKPHYENFSCFYFVSRFLLLLLDAFVQERVFWDISLVLTSVLIASFFIFFQPYKSTDMNYHDSLLLINISVISILKTGYDMAYLPIERRSFDKAIHALAYLPFLCLLFRLITWLIKKVNRLYAARQRKRRNPRRSSNSRIPYRIRELDASYMQYEDSE